MLLRLQRRRRKNDDDDCCHCLHSSSFFSFFLAVLIAFMVSFCWSVPPEFLQYFFLQLYPINNTMKTNNTSSMMIDDSSTPMGIPETFDVNLFWLVQFSSVTTLTLPPPSKGWLDDGNLGLSMLSPRK